MFYIINSIKQAKFYAKVKAALVSEKGEVNVVAIVVLIGVAVVLAIIFKDQVSALIKNLFAAIGGNADSAIATE